MFPNAIHVIQKKELYQAWWPEKFQRNGAHVLADYDDARDFNYLELNGDYDLFGDGSVSSQHPGPHAGPPVDEVRLPETGTVLLSQDAIWMEENLEGYPAGLNYSVMDYTKSVQSPEDDHAISRTQSYGSAIAGTSTTRWVKSGISSYRVLKELACRGLFVFAWWP